MSKILLVSLMLMSGLAYANSCAFPNIEKQDQASNIVFIGKVEKKIKDYSLFNNKYAINVITSVKGNLQGTVTIWSANLSSCGMEFRANETYVIFVRMRDGKMTTGLSSSWIMSESYQYLTNEFIQFYKIPEPVVDP